MTNKYIPSEVKYVRKYGLISRNFISSMLCNKYIEEYFGTSKCILSEKQKQEFKKTDKYKQWKEEKKQMKKFK